MKKKYSFLTRVALVLCFAGAGLWLVGQKAEPTSLADQWKGVEAEMKKGLPKTAIEKLEPFIKRAVEEDARAEAIRGVVQRVNLEGAIQGNKPEEKIVRLEAEMAKAPEALRPMLQAVLANWYWHYFQNNRWRFAQRSRTAEAPGDDMQTWDLPRILAEIDKQFQRTLGYEEALKAEKVGDYDFLLTKGSAPDSYRPTLYDFVAHDALRFYSAGEQAGSEAQDAFQLSADSPVFASAEDFVKWEPETEDVTSATVRALRIFRDLLRFHEEDENPDAFCDADLLRLQFAYNKAFGEEKKARYKAALKRFSDRWADHPTSARALYRRANVLHGEGDRVEARRLAKRGVATHPDSPGGAECHNLIRRIEEKTVAITTERVWNAPFPSIDLRYRNLTKAYLRVVSFDWVDRVTRTRGQPEWLDHRNRAAWLREKPVLEWAVDLPATEDYHERLERIPAPEDLKPGSYFVFVSHDPKFGEANNRVNYAGVWVSDLSLVMRTRHGSGRVEGFVLDAVTGEPVEGATVRAWRRERNGSRREVNPARSDANGLFRFAAPNNSLIVHATHQGRSLGAGRDYWSNNRVHKPRPYEQTVFFTDRSLYRPGQTIRYKGVCYRVDRENDSYKVAPGRDLTVVFRDRNGQEIARRKQRSNDFGSFDGSFTAPRDRLRGMMRLHVEGGPGGSASVNVEEYKRPKFRVTVEPPAEAAKLGGEVKVRGSAMAYTGAAVNDALVKYRVVREVRYPPWWGWYCWWRPVPSTPAKEIAHGTTRTEADGSFEVAFNAAPDPSVPEADSPTFRYVTYADVTDGAGETRSGERSVSVGYVALQAALSADPWQTADKPVKVSLKTTSLDGEGRIAEGLLKLHRLKAPEKTNRAKLGGRRHHFHPRGGRAGDEQKPAPDLSNPDSWELGEVVSEKTFTTDGEGGQAFSFDLKAGAYRAVVETEDRFGKEVKALLPILVMEPGAKKFALKVPNHVAAPSWTVEPGDSLQALWGTGYDKGRAYVEIIHRRKPLQAYWTDGAVTQAAIEQKVTEALRGGFTLHVTYVRENRAYLTTRKVNVPWTNKNLQVKWERFTSKLEPGAKETWTAVVTGPDAKGAVAEMVAALYDESLDAYKGHSWRQNFAGLFRQDSSNLSSRFENELRGFQHLQGHWPGRHKGVSWSYRNFRSEMVGALWGGRAHLAGFNRATAFSFAESAAMPATAAPPMAIADAAPAMEADFAAVPLVAANAKGGQAAGRDPGAGAAPAKPKGPDLTQVTARKNLSETAFFFPKLVSNEEGEVRLEFTMPEALTQWKFLGFVHDEELRAGFLTDSMVTAKDLMVQPNPPRFLREGDVLEFTVKVSNQSPTIQKGAVRLTFNDARTGKRVDPSLGNEKTDLTFEVPAKQSKTYSWKITVPDESGYLTYKAIGATRKVSDGEEGYLPVLSRRILVTESLPLPIRGAKTKQFSFAKLLASGKSDSLRHKNLSVQMVSNPAWYAVMALPYLMEYPHECSEQTFNRYYANALARSIAASDPKIRRVFDQWKGTETLDSPLEKNEDLKDVALMETPWVRQAKSESEARRNVGVLFDDNRLNDELGRAFRKLAQMQLGNGAWPWFPGGRANDYVTLYLTTGFGRLRHLGVQVDPSLAIKSLNRLDGWIDKTYRDVLKYGRKEKNNLNSTIALYLYGRSFFLQDRKINPKAKEAVDYFLGQAREYWLQTGVRQTQGHLALALKRFGDKETPAAIMRSLKERSVTDEELGAFWRDTEFSWWWYRAPIETQAIMIEAFDEVANDQRMVEDCKVWLLKQKQTQDWKTTKATADAVYALLLRGSDLLASDELVRVSLAGQPVKPEKVEAGTGFYEKRYANREIRPDFGKITLTKADEGVAWGAVHWQYLEDVGKITPHEATPLKLKKALYVKVNTAKGPTLVPVRGAVAVGDELVVRIELRTDRDMEYVHMKDHRGSGTEPVNVLSRYRYRDGLGYYESTRDTASHFYFDYLPKGVYVFEYSLRVQHRGQYQTGMANIQCMYAPEFNSHSESIPLRVE